MKKIERKDIVEKQISKGVEAFKKVNAYPPFLHAKIIAGLERKTAEHAGHFNLIPRAAVALVLILIVAFSGAKMLEKYNPVMYNEMPVAVVLSLESQANLMKIDMGTALDDSIKSAIYNMEQSGS